MYEKKATRPCAAMRWPANENCIAYEDGFFNGACFLFAGIGSRLFAVNKADPASKAGAHQQSVEDH
jgi:hypothetical protein